MNSNSINSALISSSLSSSEYNGISTDQRLTLDVLDLYYKPKLHFSAKALQCFNPILPKSISDKLVQFVKKVK